MVNLEDEEKETIIIFNESEKTAEIFTYNKKLKSKLKKLFKKEPEIINFIKDNGDGGLTYTVPKEWIKIYE